MERIGVMMTRDELFSLDYYDNLVREIDITLTKSIYDRNEDDARAMFDISLQQLMRRDGEFPMEQYMYMYTCGCVIKDIHLLAKNIFNDMTFVDNKSVDLSTIDFDIPIQISPKVSPEGGPSVWLSVKEGTIKIDVPYRHQSLTLSIPVKNIPGFKCYIPRARVYMKAYPKENIKKALTESNIRILPYALISRDPDFGKHFLNMLDVLQMPPEYHYDMGLEEELEYFKNAMREEAVSYRMSNYANSNTRIYDSMEYAVNSMITCALGTPNLIRFKVGNRLEGTNLLPKFNISKTEEFSVVG